MPQILQTIDQIANELKRDVLMLTFCGQPPVFNPLDTTPCDAWETDPARQTVIAWLEANGYAHQPCYPQLPAGTVASPYPGSLFLETPHAPGDPDYQKLQAFLEHADGSMRHAGVGFYTVRPDTAAISL